MKKKVVKFYRWILALMGLGTVSTGCETLRGIIDPVVCMYGMPYMEYEVSGNVSDKGGKSIPGIEVINDNDFDARDTTDVDGNFYLKGSEFPKEKISVSFRDIDSTLNGSFSDKTIEVSLKRVSKGDGSWYDGAYEANKIKVVLDSKETE